jgi:hypothetical protein
MKPCLDGCLEKIKICISIYARKVMLYNHVKFKSQTPINLGGCKKNKICTNSYSPLSIAEFDFFIPW